MGNLKGNEGRTEKGSKERKMRRKMEEGCEERDGRRE